MALVAQELSASRGGKQLFRSLNFRCAPGECLAIQGPSGSGKTTLLRIVAGLDDPDHGSVSLKGKLPSEWGWPTYRRSVCFVHQRAVVRDETVLENLKYPFTFDISGKQTFDLELATTLLEAVNLGDKGSAQASSLSHGEQQRMALVRALVAKPKFILLDEPTSALDAPSRDGMERLLMEQRDQGLGMLLVTHDSEQAGRLSDRQLSLLSGLAHD